jgi:putative ABC transport system ATP-binding protein
MAMIRVNDLYKSFRDGDRTHAVLRGLSFDVADGEFVALLGRSGSGKSTLLNCIAGIETVDTGSIEIAGTDLARLDDDARTHLRRDAIGIVFQFFNLLPVISVLDNVLLPAELAGRADRETRDRAHRLLGELGLAGREGELPDHLSGGEQQRVAIARALINEPRLLLADEPTGNLDSKTGADTLELLQQINADQKVAIVMATHSRDAAARAGRIVHLADGALVEAS